MGIGLLALIFAAAGCEPRGNDRSDPEFPDGTQWIYGKDVSGWPRTINITSASHDRRSVTLEYDRLNEIPRWDADHNRAQNVNGNIWLIRQYNGVWYISTFDYLRVGQTTKAFGPGPLFRPQEGDKIGFMVSTMARAENGTVARGVTYQERSNIFWTTW